MPRPIYALIIAGLCASPVLADSFTCTGEAPNWSLTTEGATARFSFPAPTDMDVMLDTQAEGRDWPRALTLIGARDSAILLIEEESCSDTPYRAHVMTQRGQTPILLTGCCERRE